MVITLDFESSNPSSNLGGTWLSNLKFCIMHEKNMFSATENQLIDKILIENELLLSFLISTVTISKLVVMMAEWLRRWTRNPMGSPRAGSNPAHDE